MNKKKILIFSLLAGWIFSLISYAGGKSYEAPCVYEDKSRFLNKNTRINNSDGKVKARVLTASNQDLNRLRFYLIREIKHKGGVCTIGDFFYVGEEFINPIPEDMNAPKEAWVGVDIDLKKAAHDSIYEAMNYRPDGIVVYDESNQSFFYLANEIEYREDNFVLYISCSPIESENSEKSLSDKDLLSLKVRAVVHLD